MTLPPSVIVVFGAAVWEGGRASNAMRRRIRGALASAPEHGEVLYMLTGGVGKHPPSEARVMADLLEEAGVPESRVLLDEGAGDTLESVRNCVALLRQLPAYGDVIVCSDTYHIPRCRLLFRMYGIPTRPGKVVSGWRENTARRWFYYYLREIVAIPWDTLLVALSAQRG